jgi:hypothetical protein
MHQQLSGSIREAEGFGIAEILNGLRFRSGLLVHRWLIYAMK